jgi:hypothetical protein
MINWDLILKILNVVQFLLLIYFYIENRRLKGFETEKNLKLKKLELKELNKKYKKDQSKINNKAAARGVYHSGIRIDNLSSLKEQFEIDEGKLTAEIEYLERLKKYKWIFSK